jgi:hypothetical protein
MDLILSQKHIRSFQPFMKPSSCVTIQEKGLWEDSKCSLLSYARPTYFSGYYELQFYVSPWQPNSRFRNSIIMILTEKHNENQKLGQSPTTYLQIPIRLAQFFVKMICSRQLHTEGSGINLNRNVQPSPANVLYSQHTNYWFLVHLTAVLNFRLLK